MKPNVRLQLFPLVRVAVSLIAGIALGDAAWPTVPLRAWIAAAVVGAALSVGLRRWAVAQGVAMLLTTLLVGASLVSASLRRDSVAIDDAPISYEAVVVGTPVERGRVVRCDLMVTSGRLAGHKLKASILRDTVNRRYTALRVGLGLRATSVMERPRQIRAGSNFDYPRWMQVQGFAANTFIFYSDWQPRRVSLAALSRLERAKIAALRLRQRLLQRYQQQADDGQAYAVVAAMTLGDKSALSGQLKDIYSVTGASHILALSGLHLGIIYAILSFLFARRRWQLWGQAVSVTAIWAYALMVGLAPSVLRAATMFTVYAAVSVLGRNKASLNTLAFTAVVMLCVSPLTLWDVGFQMSFISVLGILLLYGPIYRLLDAEWLMRHRLLRWLWGMMAVSVSAQTTVAPLVAYYFGRFSCYFLLTNMIAIPLSTLIIYCAVAMFLASPLPFLQDLLAHALFAMAQWLNALLAFVAALPGSSIEAIDINRWQLLCIYVLLACLCGLCHYAWLMWRSAHHAWK